MLNIGSYVPSVLSDMPNTSCSFCPNSTPSIFDPEANNNSNTLYTEKKNQLFTKMLETKVTNDIKKLEEISKSTELSDDQKEKIQAGVNKFKELAEKIKTLQNSQKNAPEISEIITALQDEYNVTFKEVEEIITKIEEERANSADGAADGTDAADATDTAGTADTNVTDTDAAKKKATDAAQLALKYNMTKICDLLDEAMHGMGTNYDKNENGIKNIIENNINKDNILELLNQWDENYKGKNSYRHGNEAKYGLIGALMNECEGKQKQEIASMIIEALAERALKDGIDVNKEVSAARASCKPNWIGIRNKNKICAAINTLKNKILASENKIKTKKTEETDNNNVEKEQKTKEKQDEVTKKQEKEIEEKTKQFIEDMKECLENDNIKILPGKVKVSKDEKGNFKGFTIRIKGKEYFGKDYLSLVAALEKDNQVLPTK